MPENGTELDKLRIPADKKNPPKRRWVRKLALWGGILGAIIVALYSTPYYIPTSVETTAVRRVSAATQTSTTVLAVTGYVIADRRVELAPKIVGRISELLADEGDKVTSGSVVARLEDFEAQANLQRAKAAKERAQARYAELLAGSRPEEVQRLAAEAEATAALLRDAQQRLARVRPLVEQRVENRETLDKAQNEVDQLTARNTAAKLALRLAQIGTRQEVIAEAKAAAEEAAAQLRLAEIGLEDTLVRAPLSGTVVERIVEPGMMVTNTSFGGTRGARSALMSIADLTDLQIEIDLNQIDLPKIRRNQECRVSLESYPQSDYAGFVETIASEANRQKATVQVKVAVRNPDALMKPEMNARVSFLEPLKSEGSKNSERLYVPVSAVIDRDGKSKVVIVSGGRAKLLEVSRGLETPEGVEISSGLSGDERIVVRPPDRIQDGIALKETTASKP